MKCHLQAPAEFLVAVGVPSREGHRGRPARCDRDGDTVSVDCERLTGPTTVTVGCIEVTALPPIVAVIVSLPAVVPVNVAV